jgi:precorrin-6B methylase 1
MTADELLDGESDDSQSAGKGMTSVSTMRGEHEAPQSASRLTDNEQRLVVFEDAQTNPAEIAFMLHQST